MGFFDSLFGGKNRMDRDEYNDKVGQLIRDDFGFHPNSRVDPRFPGVLAYLELLDDVYYIDGPPEQAALRVMLPFFSGLRKSELGKDQSDANLLFEKIKRNMHLYFSHGAISQDIFDQYSAILKKHTGLDV